MKKILFFIITLIIFIPIVNAVSYVGTVTGSGVYIRKGPGTNYSTVKQSSNGVIYNMPNNTIYKDESTGCPNGWYQVNYDTSDQSLVGYICSNYLTVNQKIEDDSSTTTEDAEPSTECQKKMKDAGFPQAYWKGLCALQEKYPNWQFNAINKDKDGNTVSLEAAIKEEFDSCDNTISSSSNSIYIRTDSVCTRSLDSGMSNASLAAVRYYMNPTNFLTEKYIFMFESQYNNTGISSTLYNSAVKKIFNNNFLVQKITYMPDLVTKAASESGISQTAIASRIKQELGNAKLTSGTYSGQLYSAVSGNYTTRYNLYYNSSTGKFVSDKTQISVDNYYNFYNIGAYDGSGVTQKALVYAYKKSWGGTGNQQNDRQTAVTGGAKWIKTNYTDVGQHTIYFNKFNTFPNKSSSRYLHQYMTNITAPVSESTILYNAYNSLGMLATGTSSLPFVFYIPVYNDITYEAVDDTTTNTDTGTDTTVTPVVEEVVKVNVTTAVAAAGYKLSDSYLTNVKVGTKTDDLISDIESKGVDVTVTKSDGTKADTLLGTGYKVVIDGATKETYYVVIYGDVSGDGKINALDLLKTQKHILGIVTLKGAQKIAADPSKDNNVNALDLLKIQKHILGISSISQ